MMTYLFPDGPPSDDDRFLDRLSAELTRLLTQIAGPGPEPLALKLASRLVEGAAFDAAYSLSADTSGELIRIAALLDGIAGASQVQRPA